MQPRIVFIRFTLQSPPIGRRYVIEYCEYDYIWNHLVYYINGVRNLPVKYRLLLHLDLFTYYACTNGVQLCLWLLRIKLFLVRKTDLVRRFVRYTDICFAEILFFTNYRNLDRTYCKTPTFKFCHRNFWTKLTTNCHVIWELNRWLYKNIKTVN